MPEIKVRFKPGVVVATPAVMRKVDKDSAGAALLRQLQGRLGLVCEEDWAANEKALEHGGRLLSVFPLPNEAADFWIMSEGPEGERITTLLLPSDY